MTVFGRLFKARDKPHNSLNGSGYSFFFGSTASGKAVNERSAMQMLGADLTAHRVNYNNNPVLKWCLTNTGTQTDRNGNIVPIKNQSPKQRIDGTAALLDCYVGLYEHYNEFTGAIQ